MSNNLDPDQVQRIVGPDLGPNCLPRLSADETGRQELRNYDTWSRACKTFFILMSAEHEIYHADKC